jgi:hypothetical protein
LLSSQVPFFYLAHQQNEAHEEDVAVQDLVEDIEFPDGKIGAKKRAKLEAKAERKAQREVGYSFTGF